MNHMSHVHRNFALGLVLAALAASGAWAQGPSTSPSSADQSVGASASLTIPLEIYDTADLTFGELVKTAAHDTGEVIVSFVPFGNSNGGLSSGDPAKVVATPVPFQTHTGFVRFTGDPLRQFIFTVPSSINLEKVAGTAIPQQLMALDVSVGVFESTGGPSELGIPLAAGGYQIPQGGAAQLELGGDLHVKFDNESGAYSGTIPVTVSYL